MELWNERVQAQVLSEAFERCLLGRQRMRADQWQHDMHEEVPVRIHVPIDLRPEQPLHVEYDSGHVPSDLLTHFEPIALC